MCTGGGGHVSLWALGFPAFLALWPALNLSWASVWCLVELAYFATFLSLGTRKATWAHLTVHLVGSPASLTLQSSPALDALGGYGIPRDYLPCVSQAGNKRTNCHSAVCTGRPAFVGSKLPSIDLARWVTLWKLDVPPWVQRCGILQQWMADGWLWRLSLPVASSQSKQTGLFLATDGGAVFPCAFHCRAKSPAGWSVLFCLSQHLVLLLSTVTPLGSVYLGTMTGALT